MKRPSRVRIVVALLAATALAACAANAGAPNSAASKPAADKQAAPGAGKGYAHDPFPSTYHAYPGVPTLVKNVTIYDGEGGRIDGGSVLFADGKIVALGQMLETPAGAQVIDGTGKWVTPGIIDIHSHLGDYPSPQVQALSDGNEATAPVTADVWAEHSVWPQDPGFGRALANGGVTTLQILPGSANLFGGRSVVLKNVYARTMQGMKFPGAPYGLKMACGENPKRVYGSRNTKPSTRMGNIAVDRATWAKAVAYKRKWDKFEKDGGDAPERDIAMDTLRGVLAGEILVQNHCYRADEMAIVMDMAKEFGYHVTAFHHAVEAYKIADLLKANDTCAAVWADWYGFKMESFDGIGENLALLQKAGACGMIHSDDENGIQRLNQEVAKAQASGRRAGIDIPDAVAWEWLSYNPAKALGIADRTGSLKPGKMADVVLWNGNPLSVYTRPEKVWIDGALLYDAGNPRLRPVSDFELGQPGSGRREMKAVLLSLTALAATLAAPASAQTVAITGGTVAIGDGSQPIERGTVLMRDGRIVAAGAGVAVPAGATVIDATGKWVAAGMVAGFTNLGLVDAEGVRESNDVAPRTSPFNAGIDIAIAINPQAVEIGNERAGGITRALVSPGTGGSIFAGQGAVIDLGEDADPVMRARAFQYVELGEDGANDAGGSRPAAYAMFHDALAQAQDYRRNPAGFGGREKDSLLKRADAAALLPVIDGRMPLFVHVERASDIRSVLALKKQYPTLKLVLVGSREGWMVAPEIAAAKVPVIAAALADLPASFEALAATESNVGRMTAAGVTVAISTVGANTAPGEHVLAQYAGNLVAITRVPGSTGLTWGQAFATVSSKPAQALGMDGEIGSLRPGRRADVVIWDGDPLELSSAPTAVYIDGKPQSMRSRQRELRDRYAVPQEGALPKAYSR